MYLQYQLMKTLQDERLREAERGHLTAEARRARTAGRGHAAATVRWTMRLLKKSSRELDAGKGGGRSPGSALTRIGTEQNLGHGAVSAISRRMSLIGGFQPGWSRARAELTCWSRANASAIGPISSRACSRVTDSTRPAHPQPC